MKNQITFKEVKNSLIAFLPNGRQDIVIQFLHNIRPIEIERAKSEYISRYGR
jgi:hypothetical protein